MGFLDRAKERAEELSKKAKPMAEDLSRKAKPAAENLREKAKPMAKSLGERAATLAHQAKKSAEEFRGGLHGDDASPSTAQQPQTPPTGSWTPADTAAEDETHPVAPPPGTEPPLTPPAPPAS